VGPLRRGLLNVEACKISQYLVFLSADATLLQVLRQPRHGLARGHPGDLEIHVVRYEIETFRARDFLIVGIGDASQQAAEARPFHV
jgi:hypothetical protein